MSRLLTYGILNQRRPAPPVPLLLDLYPGAAAAYSLRKLRNDYTGAAIRVRRSSDNTEQDIAFSGDDLDTVALLNFVGAGNGFVTTWYDQSLNARNATQATVGQQPRIVNAGAVEMIGGAPTLNFLNGTTTLLKTVDFGLQQPVSQFTQWQSPSGSVQVLTDGVIIDLAASLTILSATSLRNFAGVSLTQTVANITNVKGLSFLRFEGVNSAIGYNGGALVIGNAGTNLMRGVTIGASGNSSAAPYNGFIFCHIVYPNDQATNRSAIELILNS
jgi:hypothetical protein